MSVSDIELMLALDSATAMVVVEELEDGHPIFEKESRAMRQKINRQKAEARKKMWPKWDEMDIRAKAVVQSKWQYDKQMRKYVRRDKPLDVSKIVVRMKKLSKRMRRMGSKLARRAQKYR